jgi:hypothetical protein
LNAPKAQGVTGFVSKKSSFSLADLEVRSTNDYATVLAVAMDDKPLRTSGKILVQVGTSEWPSGWQTKPAQVNRRPGEEVVSFGHAPWMIARSHLTISIANAGLSRAVVLDPNGMPQKEIRLQDIGGRKRLQFPEEALYVVLQ